MRRIFSVLFFGLLISCAASSNKEQLDHQDSIDFAINELQFRIKSDPTNPAGYVALGKAFMELGCNEDALQQFDSALDLEPDYTEAHLQTAILFWKKNENENASRIFNKILALPDANNYAFTIGKSIGHPYHIVQLTDFDFDCAYPSCSPVANQIAMQSNEKGNWDIYLFDLDSGSKRRVTENNARDENPVFSHDGHHIIFTSTRNDTTHLHIEELQRDIYLKDLHTNQNIQITYDAHDDWAPAFSPDGTVLLFSSDRDDARQVPITDRWASLYQFEFVTKKTERLSFYNANDIAGCFSALGDGIYFCSDRKGEYDVFYKPLNATENGGSIRKALSHSGDDGGVKISPDGKRVVFFSQIDGNYDIYLADLPTKRVRRLTNHPALDGAPVFSPQGDKIYFHSNRSGKYQIHVIDLNSPVSIDELEQTLNQI